MKRTHSIAPCFCLAVLLASTSAFAQEPEAAPTPAAGAGTGVSKAAEGPAELEGQGEFGKAKSLEDVEKAEDFTNFKLSLGGLGATGNATSVAFTGNALYELRRKKHMFHSSFIANYGLARVEDEVAMTDDLEPNIFNLQGRLRYDYFLKKRIAVFLMLTGRHDPFQGLKFRLNVDPGFAFFILKGSGDRFGGSHDLWAEVGYDLQVDIRCSAELDLDLCATETFNPPPTAENPTPEMIDRQFINHSARLFAGYSAKGKDDRVSFRTGLEYLQSFLDGTQHGFAPQKILYKISWDNSFSVPVLETRNGAKLAFAVSFSLRYDKTLPPSPDVVPLDTLTAANIVLDLGGAVAPKKPKSAPAPAPAPAPAEAQPAATQPAATQPAATQPTATQPAETQPATTQPAPQPAMTQPAPGRSLAFATHLGL